MIEMKGLMFLYNQMNETFGNAVEWLSDAFVQVGLGVVIWVGYVRHWVSVAFNVSRRLS